MATLSEDLLSGVVRQSHPPSPADLIYASSLLSSLTTCLLTDSYPLFTQTGYRRAGPPDVVLLSAYADSGLTYRHKTLGYRIEMPAWHAAAAGARIREWIQHAFEPERRSLDDIKADYVALIDEMRSRAPKDRPTKFLIMNTFSTSAYDDLQSYAGFDAPMGHTLETILEKDINLMLQDLARERDIAILDFDAIAAELGAQHHLPDGAHPSGTLVSEGRAEILRILRAQNVPGFVNARAS